MRDAASHRDEGSRLATLETRMGQLEDGFKTMIAKLDARSGINWAPVSIMVTIMVATLGAGFAYINGSMSRLETGQEKAERRSESYVPRVDLETRFTVLAQRRDDAQRVTDGRMERSERDIDALQKGQVPCGEHEQMWLRQRDVDSEFRRQFDEVRKAYGDLYTPRDTILDLRRRLEEMERRAPRPGG